MHTHTSVLRECRRFQDRACREARSARISLRAFPGIWNRGFRVLGVACGAVAKGSEKNQFDRLEGFSKWLNCRRSQTMAWTQPQPQPVAHLPKRLRKISITSLAQLSRWLNYRRQRRQPRQTQHSEHVALPKRLINIGLISLEPFEMATAQLSLWAPGATIDGRD
jgi:hypothetical protein